MTTALVIHGHFYQPPRENPWTELVEREPGASPFHDWNERIHAEVEIARDAARYGYRIDRTSVTRVFEETVNEATRLVVTRPGADDIRSARALIELGRELGLEANLERGQEIIYEAARAGAPLSAEARDFAVALGLAPAALEQPGPTVPVKG